MNEFGHWARKLRSAILKRVSLFSDTENRNSGASRDCHLVPYPSLSKFEYESVRSIASFVIAHDIQDTAIVCLLGMG